MQIEITNEIDLKLATTRDRFYTTSKDVQYDTNKNILILRKSDGSLIEFGSVHIQKILDKEIFLKGILPSPSGTGHAPQVHFIRITFL
jgi:tyrosine-protein phosphatase YwqE